MEIAAIIIGLPIYTLFIYFVGEQDGFSRAKAAEKCKREWTASLKQ